MIVFYFSFDIRFIYANNSPFVVIFRRTFILDSQISFVQWYAKEVFDFDKLFDSLVLLSRLHYGLTYNIFKVNLDLVVNRHDLDAIVPSLVDFNLPYLVKSPVTLFFLAENSHIDFGHYAHLFVKNHAFNFASKHEENAEKHKHDRNDILPPVAFAVAIEQNTKVAKCQVVDKI